jgi:DNA-binding response OmpR family regulator
MSMDDALKFRRFGAFTLDLEHEVLLRDGQRVPLQPQPMKVLALLAARAGSSPPRCSPPSAPPRRFASRTATR